jgi:RHS repeat-associated protein
MAITHITIKPGLKQLSLALSLMLYAFGSKAQTYLAPPATLTTAPAAGSYYNNTSITLNPTFSFAAATGSSLSLYIVNPDCVPQTTALSAAQNYILTSVPRVGGITGTAGLANRTTCELLQTVQYIDGLGRPLQTVQIKGSPLVKDIVQPYAYDAYSREATKYLPYTSPTADGSYKTAATTSEIGNFYNPGGAGVSGAQQSNGIVYNPNPFSITNFETSPLNRVQEQGAPGTDWQPTAGHTVKMVYTNNNTTALSDVNNSFIANLYTATINTDQSRTLVLGNSAGNYYPAGQLYVTISKDENWVSGKPGTTEEYKDKEGHVVLKRTFNLVGTTVQTLSTYYVYDDLGELAFVLPPMSNADNALPDQTTQNNLCYQYRYDERNRLSRKKLPGKDWEYMVYNSLDQPVLTQDGVQRLANQWTVTKYDALGRVIMTGLWTDASASTQSVLQASIYGQAQWDVRNTADTNTGYTISSYPSISSYLSINYYDDYSFSNITGLPAAFNAMPTGASSQTRGQLTANKTYILGTTDALWAVSYYDGLGRNIQTYNQHYLGGTINVNNYDIISNSYDFTNAVTAVTRKHYTSASTTSPAVTIANTYAYDHMGRKTQTFEQINGGTNVLLSQTDYNEIGQPKIKHLHSTNSGASFLQNISYTYNERGWLQQSSAPLFAMQLKYNDGSTPQYNGNIANQFWGTPGSLSKNYAYSYDRLNRLTAGVSNEGYSEQAIDYDLNGNIQHLTRQANPAYVYSYTGNQLQSVSGLTTGTYTYDVNGNMQYDARTGKTYNYNLLNLPQSVSATGFNLSYTYDATGQKLRKNNGTTATDYIAGIQYENGAIVFIQTEEGRALKSGNSYIYEYSLADHLGNTRLSFDQNSATGIKQQDDYYPFGMEISRGSTVSPKNEYLYNKKELQEELGGVYDYGARFYDPVIGRWGAVDPSAEKNHHEWSPYNYVYGNPIKSADADGRDTVVVLNAPKGAHGAGHMAGLFQGSDGRFSLYSKNGTNESSGLSGPSDKGDQPGVGSFASPQDFMVSELNPVINEKTGEREYSEGYIIKTDKAQSKDEIKAIFSELKQNYSVTGSNCATMVQAGLKAAGKKDGSLSFVQQILNTALNVTKIGFGMAVGSVKAIVDEKSPNEIYKRIKKENKGTVIKPPGKLLAN